jgi:hypothetical protein
MAEEAHRVQIKHLPVKDDEALRVKLVPMPGGDNPWRTREDYVREQRRDTIRFWVTIASLIISIIGVVATTAVAILTIRGLA